MEKLNSVAVILAFLILGWAAISSTLSSFGILGNIFLALIGIAGAWYTYKTYKPIGMFSASRKDKLEAIGVIAILIALFFNGLAALSAIINAPSLANIFPIGSITLAVIGIALIVIPEFTGFKI